MASKDRGKLGPVSLSDWKRYVQRETRRLIQKEQDERRAAGETVDELGEGGVAIPPEARHQHDDPTYVTNPDVAHRMKQTEVDGQVESKADIPRFKIEPRPSATEPVTYEPELADLDLNALSQTLDSDVRPLSAEELAAFETRADREREPAPAPEPAPVPEPITAAEVAAAEPAPVVSATPKPSAKPEQVSLFDESHMTPRVTEPVAPAASPKKKREDLIEDLLDPVISLEQAATILNVCKTTVRRYTNQGLLECIRTPGNQRRFKLSTILAFVEEKDVKGIGKRGRKPGKSKTADVL